MKEKNFPNYHRELYINSTNIFLLTEPIKKRNSTNLYFLNFYLQVNANNFLIQDSIHMA